ncbi:hypothetical protein [Streptomyces pseudogriseolus]|uniref:hypothetical protein n=1 Tax=Streptomyces pseudogriseolus TaxID=36817 RepID=UPI003FA1D51C
MTLSESLSLVGPLSAFVALLIVVVGAFRTNTAKVWKEEAEAQKERANRLANDLTEIKNRLARIERENARLIQLLTALDPNRLAALRYSPDPTED